MESGDPVEKYSTLLSSSDFLFIVYFRGHWCPFCISYLTTLQSLSPSILAAGGKPLIITSELSSHLPETRKLTGYEGDAISDPQNALVSYFKNRSLLNVAITENLKKGYEHGMAQPAILVIGKDEKVFEKWAIVPSMMNMGGAKDRPKLEQVWENVQALLKGKNRVHKAYKMISVWAVLKGKIFG